MQLADAVLHAVSRRAVSSRMDIRGWGAFVAGPRLLVELAGQFDAKNTAPGLVMCNGIEAKTGVLPS